MQIITPSTGTVLEGDATLSALKVDYRLEEANGGYFFSGRTGLVAQPAAAASLWGFAWMHPRKLAVVDLLRVRGTMTTPPTTAQEWGLDAIIGRNRSSSPTGGTTILATQTGGFKKASSYPLSASVAFQTFAGGLINIATTAALSPSGTLDASEFAGDLAWELAAGVAVPRSRVFFEKDYTNGADSPIILEFGEAVLVRNSPLNAIGAAGVIRVAVEFAWHEVDPSEL